MSLGEEAASFISLYLAGSREKEIPENSFTAPIGTRNSECKQYHIYSKKIPQKDLKSAGRGVYSFLFSKYGAF